MSHEQTELTSTRMLLAAMLIVVIGMAVFIVQPGFVQGLVEYAGFSDKQAGYIASAEMFGIALATVGMSFLVKKVSWRRLCYCALMVVILGNTASAFNTGFDTFSLLRFIVGLGSGVLISLGYAIVGLTNNPDRNFSFMIVLVLLYSALILLAMPMAYAAIGMQGILIFFTLLATSGLALVRYLPVSGDSGAASNSEAVRLPANYKFIALLAVLAYFLAQGVIWSYLFLIGTAGGGSEQQVASGLTISQVFGIAGAFTTAYVSVRYHRVVILFLGTLGGVVPLMFLFGLMGAMVYAVAVCVFNFAANLMTPLLLAIIAGFDKSGSMVVYAVAMQMLGLAIGPALAALIISPGDYSNVNWLSMSLFILSFILIVLPVVASKKLTNTQEVN